MKNHQQTKKNKAAKAVAQSPEIITQEDEQMNSFFDLRTRRGQLLFFVITLVAACLTQLIPLDNLKNVFISESKVFNECNSTCPSIDIPIVPLLTKPTYWIYGTGGEGQWKHVKNVLDRLGYTRVTQNEINTADLLWAHDYPFNKLKTHMMSLQSHQRVNHLPGCGFITNKVDLSTTDLKYIPKAFKLPIDKDKFKDYSLKNPAKSFVVKHHQHRHIKIKKSEEIDFNDNGTFIQEFITNPLLVDGYKFDIGVYTIITSLDPLRVYIYYGDILFRYCSQKYHPFDPNNVEKYIVGDDYIPTWDIPSISRYYNQLGFGMKGSFDAYIQSKGLNSQIIWDQVEDAIRMAILNKEPLLNGILKNYKNKENFFEMARFDLIVDEKLKVYLMEANMSPNLSSAHFKPNFILYEQVIYNVLNLVGVGSYLNRDSMRKQDLETETMLSTNKNIAVNAQICGEVPCTESCAPIQCQLCKTCLSDQDSAELHRAYREHVNRGDTKRIFPVPINNNLKQINDEEFNLLSSNNQLMTKWFHGKCIMDHTWCQ